MKDLGRLGRATVLLFRRHPPDSSALRLPLNRPCRLPPAPPSMKMGATFLLRVPLPARFNGKYDPASRPSSTPTLLKPSDRRRFTKPGRTKPESEPRPKPPRKVLPPKVERTPEGQREREGPRQRPPEDREASEKAAKDWREKAKELGICRDCREQAIPNQTRCEACAEKHRVRHRQGNATRRESGAAGHAGGGTR